MEDKLNRLNKIYEDITVPDSLDGVIDKAISRHRSDTKAECKRSITFMKNRGLKRVGAVAATLVIGLGITVNVSPVLAMELSELPIIGSVAKLMTIREYNIENDTSRSNVKIPEVKVDNKKIQEKINGIIMAQVKLMEEEQAELDKEYKEAYLETGGKEEEFNKIETTIDYKLNYSSNNLISFSISKSQTLASAYNETVYYNIDINTGEEFTLKTLLGDEYAKTVKTKVIKQMEEKMSQDESIKYDVKYLKDDITIAEDRKFYIDDNQNVVVVFDKYEVAAGYLGAQAFIIDNMINLFGE